MPDREREPCATAFLAEPVGRGATVVALGLPEPPLCRELATRAGPLGLVAICSADVTRHDDGAVDGAPVARLRAVPEHGIAVASHLADVVLILPARAGDPALVVEETRRLLTPGGEMRTILPAHVAPALVEALHAAGFRQVEMRPVAAGVAVRARGPR